MASLAPIKGAGGANLLVDPLSQPTETTSVCMKLSADFRIKINETENIDSNDHEKV